MRKLSVLRIIKSFIIVTALLLNSTVVFAAQTYEPSSWALTQINIALAVGIANADFGSKPYTKSITRKDFCDLMINTCQTIGTKIPELPRTHPFTDTTDTKVETAYMLGLVSGMGDNIFSPYKQLTREMAAVMLSKMLVLFQSPPSQNKNNSNISNQQNLRNLFNNKTFESRRGSSNSRNRQNSSTPQNIGNNPSNDTSTTNYGTVSITTSGVLSYSQPMDPKQAESILFLYATDNNFISDWAKASLANVFTRGILIGVGEGQLKPKTNISREQAVILALNILAYCDDSKISAKGITSCVLPSPMGLQINESYYRGNVNLSWSRIPSAVAYDISLFKNGTQTYTKRITSTSLDLQNKSTHTSNANNPTFESIFGKEKEQIDATIKIVPVNKDGVASLFSITKHFIIKPWDNQNEMLFGDPTKNSFSDDATAQKFMAGIKVNIWRLNSNGTKVSSVLYLTVNKNVTDGVIKIFEYIYNGSEKFPIKDCGCYAFRDGKSQHTNGSAIDINADENYFVSKDGKVQAGSFWKPGENPYSIPPNGDVVQAFNRQGWHWSPDMHWPNGSDYMHFSLTGS